MTRPCFKAIVLAGDRANSSHLGQAFGVCAGVLVPVAGESCLVRVLRCLCASTRVRAGVICGREAELSADERLNEHAVECGYTWMAPETGPAASALAALDAGDGFPALLTSGDHPLLRPQTVDAFCQAAIDDDRDLIVGLVSYDQVQVDFPESRRTVLRFSDGAYCGSNLFALMNAQSRQGLILWRQIESARKHPWKIAAFLGWGMLVRYLTGRLSVDQAMQRLSELAGCRVGWVRVADARAAIDVDSMADWKLADALLQAEAADAGR